MDERGQLFPAPEAVSEPLQAMAAAAGEAEAAYVSLEAAITAGGAVLGRAEGTLARVAALLAGSDQDKAGGAGSLAATLESTSEAADRLLERLVGLTTAAERATDPSPWRELRGEIEAAVESLGRPPGLAAGGGSPAGSEAAGQLSLSGEGERVPTQSPDVLAALAPILGSDFAARAAAVEAARAEAASTSVPPAPLLYGAPHTQTPSSVTVAQGGPDIPAAYSMPAVSVTLQTPPLGAEYWHGLFRTPGFEEALRQFLAEWAYRQAQQANPGPGY